MTQFPEETGVYSNLALGYLLTDQYSKAKKIYETWKSKHFEGFEQEAREIFLEDLDTLEKAGIQHKDIARAKGLLKK